VPYQSGDDPRLLADLRAALRRWHRATLGDAMLALGLTDVKRRQAADPRLTQAAALRDMVRTALAWLRERGRVEYADLLERRYLRDQSVYLLADAYHVSERSIYYRLKEALVALAHALWAVEQRQVESTPSSPSLVEPPPGRWRARHLPPPTYTYLFGMDQVLAHLLDWLSDPDGHWMMSLDGMGGLGKTALAREAVGRVAETNRFADIAWLTVKPGFYTSHDSQQSDLSALTCGQVLDAIASQLGGVDLGPLSLPAKRDRVRGLLHARSYLVVLDNLETVMDCGPLPDWLWDMANPSKFLLTSRHWPASDISLSVLLLDQLAKSDSLALIRHEARLRGLREVAEASDEALHPILVVTGGNPLAMKLVVGQLVSLPLNRVLAALETAQPGLDPFYQYLYCASWDLLSAPAQHLLLQMALLPDSGGTWGDLSTVSALSDEDLAAAVVELTAHSLLQAAGLEEKTYTVHPLTRHFVSGQTGVNGDAS
jgi:hypothetical protein